MFMACINVYTYNPYLFDIDVFTILELFKFFGAGEYCDPLLRTRELTWAI